MCKSDWPDGEDASLAVRVEASVADWVLSVDNLEFRRGVDRFERDCVH